MALKQLFIERLDGNIVNVSLIQSIFIDPEDNTDLIWLMINGEIYREDLVTAEEATTRYNYLKGLLLGTTIEELERIINEQQITINILNTGIEDAAILTENINGEEVPNEEVSNE